MTPLKTVPLLLVSLCSAVTAAAAGQIPAESRVVSVTVYPDSAMVYRRATVKLPQGEQSIVFSGIIPQVDESSLRVTARGTETKLFGAQVKREFLKQVPAERVAQLQEQIRALEDQIRGLQNTRQLLQEEKAFLDSIRLYSREQLPKELVTKMPSSQELDGTLKFLDTRLRENYALVMETDLKIRETSEKADGLRRELNELSGPVQKQLNSIVVDCEAAKAGNLEVTVSYLVRGVSWQPFYDCRADFDQSQVELVTYALVRQNTGEPWEDVDMTLSTARPNVGGNLPYVAPWLLRPFTPPPAVRMKAERLGSQMQAFDGDMGRQYEAYDMAKEAAVPAQEAMVNYAAAQQRGVSVAYAVNRKVTVKPNGSEQKMPVSSQTLKANFEYSTYPRAVTSAYLGSRVQNSPDLQLLPGRVSVFLDGDYVAGSQLEGVAPGEEFDLYLGADENVKVKREMVEKKVDETIIGSIPSPTRKTVMKYKLSVENYKPKKIRVKLFEAMPVSQDDRIKVKSLSANVEPTQKDWKTRTGVWLWELDLEPKAKKEIFYTFTLEHPRDMQVEGL